jgi:hypothetical protein
MASKELKGKDPEQVLTWRTAEGLNVKPVYTQADIKGVADEIPGAFPFTRGPYASMYTARPWTVRQVCKPYPDLGCVDNSTLRDIPHGTHSTVKTIKQQQLEQP